MEFEGPNTEGSIEKLPTGVKVALLFGDKLLMQLRDQSDEIPNPNTWSFFGGGIDKEESVVDAAVREIREELGINLSPDSFTWQKLMPALHDASENTCYMAAEITSEDIRSIDLTEGQDWQLMDRETFFSHDDVTDELKNVFREYLEEHE